VQDVEELMVQFIGGFAAATVAHHAHRKAKYVGVVGIVWVLLEPDERLLGQMGSSLTLP